MEKYPKGEVRFYQNEGPYACFCNYSQHPMTIDGLTFPTMEHYFQCCKFPDDKEYFEKLRNEKDCDEVKRLANECGQEIRKNWHDIKETFMINGLRHQFSQHQDILQILLETGEKEILEDAPEDYYWGIGKDGTGQNRLGHCLMVVREELKQSVPQQEQPQ